MPRKETPPYFGNAVTGPEKTVYPECVGCYYWRATSGVVRYGEHCCHYYLDHGIGHRRKQTKKMCKSRLPKDRCRSED